MCTKGMIFMCFYCIKRDVNWFNYTISFTSLLYTLYSATQFFLPLFFIWFFRLTSENKQNCPENNATHVRTGLRRFRISFEHYSNILFQNRFFEWVPVKGRILNKHFSSPCPLLSFIFFRLLLNHSANNKNVFNLFEISNIFNSKFQYMIDDQFRTLSRFPHFLISSIFIFHMVLSDSKSNWKRRRIEKKTKKMFDLIWLR